MIVYIIGLLLTIILSEFRKKCVSCKEEYISIKFNDIRFRFKKFNYINILPAIPLTVIAALRYEVGADYTNTYVLIFKKVSNGQANQAWGDYLYTLLNKFVCIFTSDYVGIFILTAILFSYLIFKGIYEQSENITFSIYLLVCTGYYFCFLNGMRQLIAAAILMLSIKYIQEENIKKFLLCIVFASLFHASALVFLPVYFLNKIELNNFKRIAIVATFFILSKSLSSIILNVISYTKYAYHLTNINAERLGYISTLMGVIIFIFTCFWNEDVKNNIYLDLQMIALCTQAFIGIIPSANRIGWYFGISTIILIPNVLESRKDNNRKYLMLSIAILYFIYFVYIIGVKNSNLVLPYKWIFGR